MLDLGVEPPGISSLAIVSIIAEEKYEVTESSFGGSNLTRDCH